VSPNYDTGCYPLADLLSGSWRGLLGPNSDIVHLRLATTECLHETTNDRVNVYFWLPFSIIGVRICVARLESRRRSDEPFSPLRAPTVSAETTTR
jgi:hypothetical protein